MLACVPCLLVAQPAQENMLKAAFVYNFMLFTEWSHDRLDNNDSINLCINAESGMREALQTLEGKSVRGKLLKVMAKKTWNQDLVQCHALFVDYRDRSEWHVIEKIITGKGVLTVTDDREIGKKGAVIVLELKESRMVFDVNSELARKSKLLLSSKLLRLARVAR